MAERLAVPTWKRSFHPTDIEANLDALAASLEVLLPDYPVLKTDLPDAVEVEAGQEQVFAIEIETVARGTASYQWQVDTDGEGYVDLTGKTAASLTIASWAEANEGKYRCKITNTFNNTTATIYSNECVATTEEAEG